MARVELGDTLRIEWDAFDINDGNGALAPNGHFDLHYLLPEEGLVDGWHTIATNIAPENGVEHYTYDWYVDPDSVTVGFLRRIRLTVVDGGDNQNVDYSPQLVVVLP